METVSAKLVLHASPLLVPRSTDRVFRYSPEAVKHGLPPGLVGAFFLCQPGRDYTHANDYLEALHLGLWSGEAAGATTARLVANARADRHGLLPNADSTVRRTAVKVVRLHDWMLRPDLHRPRRGEPKPGPTDENGCLIVASLGEADVERLARDLESGRLVVDGTGAKPAYVAALQWTLVDFCRYLASRNVRGPLSLSMRKSSRPGEYATPHFGSPKVLRRVDPASLDHVDAATMRDVVSAIPSAGYRVAAEIIVELGARAGEVINLRAVDVPSDLHGRYVRILGKGSRWRQVPITKDLLNKIAAYKAGPRASAESLGGPRPELLLDNRDGRPLRYHALLAAFHAASAVHGLSHSITPHLGRHHYAVEFLLRDWALIQAAADNSAQASQLVALLLNGPMQTSLEELRRNLGHARSSTTERYLVTLRRIVRARFACSHEKRLLGGAA